MAERKPFLLRVDPALLDAVQRWANDDLRSLNAQIEYQLREALRQKGITTSSVRVLSLTSFEVAGVPGDRDQEFRTIADQQFGDSFNREPGANGTYTFTLKPNIAQQLRGIACPGLFRIDIGTFDQGSVQG